MLENVENLVSDRFYQVFKEWEQLLAGMGYNNYCKVIGATDCGVPQNRRRVFLVSILDQDKYFEFPKATSRVRDLDEYLEDDDMVGKKYFIDKDKIRLLDESDEIEDANRKRSQRQKTDLFSRYTPVPANGGLLF